MCLFFLLYALYAGFRYINQNSEAVMAVYPKDFLSIRSPNPSDDEAEETPLIYASGEGAHGPFRIVYYNDYDTYEKKYEICHG